MAKLAKAPDSFEAALADLERIIQSMQDGGLSLDDSLNAYKKGIELLHFCQNKLSAAEEQLKILDNHQLQALELPNGS